MKSGRITLAKFGRVQRRGIARRFAGLAAGLLLSVTATGAAETPPEPAGEVALPLALAERIAGVFFDCARRNDKPRSIHILDASGVTVYMARMDGLFSDNIEVARMKAEAALYFRDNTRVWLQRAQQDPYIADRLAQLGQFTSPTGLPIVIDGQLVGAVGIGSASGDCAHEALTQVLGPQAPLVPVDH